MTAWRTLLRTVVLALALPAGTAPAADYEAPPVLRAKEILPPKLRSGAGFHVADQVPTDGLTTRFSLESDVGSFQARGRRLLELREREVSAIRELRETSRKEVFVDALGRAAKKPLAAAKNMVENPKETLDGLPEGVGRFFDRVSAGAAKAYDAATRSDVAGGEKATALAKQGAVTTRDALGYEQELRRLAKRLGVDPYTSNPELAKQLDEVASVAFAGRLGVNTLVAVAVPASIVISGTSFTNDLVYDTPRGDLVVRVEERIRAAGASEEQLRAFERNPNLTLSIQVGMAEALARLPGVAGKDAVVGFASTATSEDQARFVLEALLLLVPVHGRGGNLAELVVGPPVVARLTDGSLVVPAPVDYVSWNQRVDEFLHRPELAAPKRTILLTGRATPRAKGEIAKAGWTLREDVRP